LVLSLIDKQHCFFTLSRRRGVGEKMTVFSLFDSCKRKKRESERE